jgi:hypothetical protein
MKIEIEIATNGYIITIPPEYEDSIEKKIVIQKPEYNHHDSKKEEFECFRNLVSNLQEIFGVDNSKHNTIGYINDICSEDMRWQIQQQMKQSLENPKNDLGD